VLSNINKEKLARKIKETQPLWDSEYIENEFVDECINCWDESLSECVNAWINNEEIPETEFGEDKFTPIDILEIRESNNYLTAFEILSTYIQNPKEGKEKIWAKIHISPFKEYQLGELQEYLL
jgi:hypothetical protein